MMDRWGLIFTATLVALSLVGCVSQQEIKGRDAKYVQEGLVKYKGKLFFVKEADGKLYLRNYKGEIIIEKGKMVTSAFQEALGDMREGTTEIRGGNATLSMYYLINKANEPRNYMGLKIKNVNGFIKDYSLRDNVKKHQSLIEVFRE